MKIPRKRLSILRWMSLFGGHPIPLGNGVTAYNPITAIAPTTWWDFSDVSTLFQDGDRTNPITSDAQTMVGITDKSGNGNHVVSGGVLYKSGIYNGRSIARFAVATGNILNSGIINHNIGTGDFWWCWVLKDAGPGGAARALGMNASFAPSMVFGGTPNIPTAYWGGYKNFATTVSIGVLHIFELYRESGVLKSTLDGVNDANTFAVATSMANAVFALGTEGAGPTRWNGDMGEFYMKNALPSSEVRSAHRTYLMNKWGF